MKKCIMCGVWKFESQFCKNSASKDGLHCRCKDCEKERVSRYRSGLLPLKALHKVSHKVSDEEKRIRNKERMYRFRNNNPLRHEFLQQKSILTRAGCNIDENELLDFLKHRPKVCEICKTEDKTGRRLSVDHDHATGKLRGYLCYSCNRRLLGATESPEVLRRAALYLETTWQQRLK